MDKFTTLSVTVTEEINPKKVLTFIRTQIKLKNFLTNEKSCFYYSFLPESLKYEIILFQTIEDSYASLIFSFSSLCKESDLFSLFITQNFFTLYKQKKLLLVKRITATSQEDIESYIEQTYKIKLSKTVVFNNEQLKQFHTINSKSYKKEIAKQLYNLNPNNSFKYFVLYVSICFFFLVLFFYENYFTKSFQNPQTRVMNYEPLTKEEMVFQLHTKKDVSKKMKDFLEFLIIKNIQFKVIEYSGDRLHITLISNSKKALFEILDYSKNKAVLKSIKEDGNLKQYIMEVTLND